MLTLNARLLGSKVSLFQNVCVIGYCLFPLIVSSMFMGIAMLPNIIKFFVNIACVVWSIKCKFFSVLIGNRFDEANLLLHE